MYDADKIQATVASFKQDPESVYNTWFINNDTRLKAFGAIRRGVEHVIADIRSGEFPTDFKGSSLEVVLSAITEQKQVFEGAAHAFYWKPKLRIPDIYESDGNKLAFGQFLESSLQAKNAEQLVTAIARLDSLKIKGLGPAVANILYFLHPTLIPPSNTAILNGFNLLFGEKMKLGSWKSYLQMREQIMDANGNLRNVLSKDLGAFTGLLFEVGSGRLVVDENLQLVSDKERAKREKAFAKRSRQQREDAEEENLHTKMQHTLLTIGRELGYDVYVASNDRSKCHGNDKLGFLSIPELPQMEAEPDVRSTVSLIDVLWLTKGGNRVVCAFEVEKSTSIYSGILRMVDLVRGLPGSVDAKLYLVAPNHREKEILAQLRRPSLSIKDRECLSYILFADLEEHCGSICKLGTDHTIMDRIAK